jgi:plasmid stabilization system protein ParE
LDVILAPSAKVELAEIWSSIAIEDPDAADRMIDRIVTGLDRLALFPLIPAAVTVSPSLSLSSPVSGLGDAHIDRASD